MKSKIAIVALTGAMTIGALGAAAAPAHARSFLVIEPGRAKVSAGMIECTQFVMERDGADVVNFSVQPRVEKEKAKPYRYRDSRGRNKVGYKKVAAAVGGTVNSRWENRQFGGRNANARVSTGSFQRPSDPWTYRRHVEGHGKYRCVAIVTALVRDASGVLHHRRGVRVEGPWVNTAHR